MTPEPPFQHKKTRNCSVRHIRKQNSIFNFPLSVLSGDYQTSGGGTCGLQFSPLRHVRFTKRVQLPWGSTRAPQAKHTALGLTAQVRVATAVCAAVGRALSLQHVTHRDRSCSVEAGGREEMGLELSSSSTPVPPFFRDSTIATPGVALGPLTFDLGPTCYNDDPRDPDLFKPRRERRQMERTPSVTALDTCCISAKDPGRA